MHSLDEARGAPLARSDSAAPARRPTASAGFGSPGSDSTVRRIDLNDALIRHPQASYVMRAAGGAMTDAGIDDGDVLLVDRAIRPASGHVVIAVVDSELTCRRLSHHDGATVLRAASPGHPDVLIGPDRPLEVWGVVTHVIKSLLS